MESKIKLLFFFILLASINLVESQCPTCSTDCPTRDCINHSLVQTRCGEVANQPPSYNNVWKDRGLSVDTDQLVKRGEIIAYKIQWFNGAWSNWYVTGVNDLDCKYNIGTCGNSLRRMWSYFIDHTHTYIICHNNF